MGKHQLHVVRLTEEERILLNKQTKSGEWRPREIQRAMILLLADIDGPHVMQDHEICEKLGCSRTAINYRRRRFVTTQSIEDTIFDNPRSGRPTIVDGAIEAHITKIACSSPPAGHVRWTVNLIRDRVVSLEIIDEISPSTIERTLKKSHQAVVKAGMENPS